MKDKNKIPTHFFLRHFSPIVSKLSIASLLLILGILLFTAPALAKPQDGLHIAPTRGPVETPTYATPTPLLPTPTPTPSSGHTECSDAGMCMKLDTPGSDECNLDADCMRRFCDVDGSCVEIPGDPSASACSDTNPCKKACFNGLCMLRVPGVPEDAPECSSARDCAHYACEGKSCVLKPGPGQDTCKGAGDCAQYTMCVGSKCVASTFSKNRDCSTNDDCVRRTCIGGYCHGLKADSGPDECSSDGDCGHRVCKDMSCSQVPGSGLDECSSSSECMHTVCQYRSCVAVAGKGENKCKSHADCGPAYRVCQGYFCNLVPGLGSEQDQCSSDSDCTHKGCVEGRCGLVKGSGPDTCSEDGQCYHWRCDKTKGLCLRSPGDGEDQCSSHSECGHLECSNANACKRFPGSGPDTCTRDQDCGPSHRVCSEGHLGIRGCKQVKGTGANECATPADCYNVGSHRGGSNGSNSSFASAEAHPLSPEQIRNVLDQSVAGSQSIQNFGPIKVVMFQDLGCGMCGLFYREIMPTLDKEYVKTGLINFEAREFPLGGRQRERDLAEYSLCAAEQNKDQQLFITWLFKEKRKENPSINTIVSDLKLDSGKFQACLKKGEKKSQVQRDIDIGNILNVEGTPTFFIDGKVLEGVQGYDRFKTMIDEALANRAKEAPAPVVTSKLTPKPAPKASATPRSGDEW